MDTWWIDEPRVVGSSNPTIEDLGRLRQDGFSVLVSLLKEEDQKPRYDISRATAMGFVRQNIPVEDFHPPTIAQLEQFVDLAASLPPGARIVVHCEGGSGRTGTFAAAYWIARGLAVADAIAHVRRVRRRAVETQTQEAALSDFAARRKGFV